MKNDYVCKRQIERLAFEADQAMDLLDRGDYRDLIANLLASIQMLVAENEALTRDRDEMTRRLSRQPLSDAVPARLLPVARQSHQTPAPQPQAAHIKPEDGRRPPAHGKVSLVLKLAPETVGAGPIA
jgi:hypothetical protein